MLLRAYGKYIMTGFEHGGGGGGGGGDTELSMHAHTGSPQHLTLTLLYSQMKS